MANLYVAECARCRIGFRAPAIIGFGSDPGIHIEEVQINCPQCKQMCPLTIGRREVSSDGSVRYYFGYDRAGDALDRKIADRLVEQIRAADSALEAAEIIERQAPWLTPLATWLRQNEHLGTWLAVVLAVVALLAQWPQEAAERSAPGQVEEVLREVLDEIGEDADGTTPEPPAMTSQPGRPGPRAATPSTESEPRPPSTEASRP